MQVSSDFLEQKYEVLTSWHQALMSGDHGQGVSWLRRGDLFSALGLLCHPLPPVNGIIWQAASEQPPDWTEVYTYDEAYTLLPKSVREPLSITAGCTIVTSDTSGESLSVTVTYLNDRGYKFREIAEIIHRELIKPLEYDLRCRSKKI